MGAAERLLVSAGHPHIGVAASVVLPLAEAAPGEPHQEGQIGMVSCLRLRRLLDFAI